MKTIKASLYISTGSFLCILIFVSYLLFLVSCKPKNERSLSVIPGSPDSNYALQIADTIIYGVVITNPDKDDEWTTYCLKNLNRELLIDFVFNAVHKGKAKAYHYFTNEEFSINDVKEIEKSPDFSRDKIAKIQFVEEWLIDSVQMKMYKRINSIMLAYEVRDEEGIIRGYKPTFRIYLNN